MLVFVRKKGTGGGGIGHPYRKCPDRVEVKNFRLQDADILLLSSLPKSCYIEDTSKLLITG
jgi:hypothetical protein